ncbi:acetyl-CoA hydrolase/transferase C-terminal domain-containing protein [Salicola sp. Rm-C-2C1-2]|uniref:acetyl-CoA hydrolase/transferase C-terminal domain-containing protein n=1 Tax=Salicola sp. Rm-C-2C1-2 TaxID=3141321 RepID=UPI0032E443B9
MTTTKTHQNFESLQQCVDAVIAKVGKDIRLGLPLGLGKPVNLVNALYQRAREDPALKLHIFTALSLEKPLSGESLERRFMAPFVDRVFKDVPDLDYVIALRQGTLPDNVQVSEFFFKAGSWIGHKEQQQNYICTNYTHAVRDLMAQGINVVGQMVAPHPAGEQRVSLSCNPDLSIDLIPVMREREAAGQPVAIMAEVNDRLPWMGHHADRSMDEFDFVLAGDDCNHPLFSAPKMPVVPEDHMIGFYASSLIRDAGTLQVGIGSLGDAVVYSTLMRHHDNARYVEAADKVGLERHFPIVNEVGGTDPLPDGLYGCSEMMVDGFLYLLQDGVLTREVFEDETLQRLIDDARIGKQVSIQTLDTLVQEGLIRSPLRARDLSWLQRFGILRAECGFKGGQLLVDDQAITPDLNDSGSRTAIEAHALGERLSGGVVMHGGFYIGPESFYKGLRELSEQERDSISMTSVCFINQLYDHAYGAQSLKQAQRRHARFINSAMMVTLNGAAVSDGLDSGQVLSGVGGQYNFVAMAHELPEGHSILTLRSVRHSGGKPVSNIVFNYGHCTIPRHLRDFVVTEYGIAYLRGKPDSEVFQELIKIADSRFQPNLVREAKKAGKIPQDWEVPAAFSNNTPDRIEAIIGDFQESHELFPRFPFGCDFTDDELKLGKVLKGLRAKGGTTRGRIQLLLQALRAPEPDAEQLRLLQRMGLSEPDSLRSRLERRLLMVGLSAIA